MSRNNTGNPIGSKAFADFEDNVKNLDEAVNTADPQWVDRFGRFRLPLMEQERQFVASQDYRDDQFQSAQSSREAVFSDFLQASGYQDLGEYAPGIEITAHNQYVTFGGQPYLLKPSIPVPYTTSGEWAGDDFKLIGDDSLRQDLANPGIGAALVAYRNTTVAAKLEDIEVTPEDFGAVGDGITDDSAAFVAMMNSRPELDGFSVKLGAKTYKLNSTALYFLRRIQMRGVSRASTILDFSGCTEVANFPYNSHIIVVHNNNIAGTSSRANPIEIPEGWVGRYGEMCGLSNLSVTCNPTVEDGNGVFFNVAAEASHIQVRNANLHNIVICGNATNLGTRGETRGPTGLDIGGNSNNGVYTNIKATGGGGDGIRVSGDDGNANLFLHADCANNDGWGINDSTLLGNTYIQPHTSSNKYGAYRVRPQSTNRSCFLGAYTEGNQGGDNEGERFELNSRATFLGATGALPNGNFPALTNENSGFVFRKPVVTMDNHTSIEQGEAYSSLGKGRLAIKTVAGKLLEIRQVNSAFNAIFYDGSPVMSFRNSNYNAIKTNRPHFQNGFSLHTSHSQTVGSDAPTAGEWSRGEIVWAVNPATLGYVGWVCTAAGEPGTWKRFGAIED